MNARRFKTPLIILGIVSLVVVAAVILAPRFLDPNRYHGLIVSEIESAVGGKVTLGRMSWGITHRIWLEVDGLSIVDASAFPGDVELTRIRGEVSIPQLLLLRLVLQDLRVKGRVASFRLEPSVTDTPSPAGEPSSADAPPTLGVEIVQIALAIDRLEIDDALSLPGKMQTHVFGDVELTARDLAPGKTMSFELSLQDKAPTGLGTLKAHGMFNGLTKAFTLDNPNLKMKVALSELNVDAVKPYFAGIPAHSQLSGTISTTVDYEGDLGQNLQAEGTIDLGRLTYSDPELWDTPLSGRDTMVTYRIKLDPNDVTVESIVVKLGKLSLDARGVVHDWSEEPIIQGAELTSELPLDEIAHLVPWKKMGEGADMLRTSLSGGGRISVSKLVFPDLNLSAFPSTAEDLVPAIEMTVALTGISVQPPTDMPEIRNIEGSAHLSKGIVDVQRLTGQIASIDVPPISGRIESLVDYPRIDARLKGRLTLGADTEEEFGDLLKASGLERLVGTADLDVTMALDTARPEAFELRGSVGLKEVRLETMFAPVLISGLDANVNIDPGAVKVSGASAVVSLAPGATSTGDHFMLDIQGQVDGWRGEPSVTLKSFKTSRVALPLLAAMIPWEKLDPSALPVKKILDAGGDISIDDLSFPSVDLSSVSKNPEQLLPRLKLAASLTNLAVPRGVSPTRVEGITGRLSLEKNVLIADNLRYRIGPFALPVLSLRATNIADQMNVSLKAKGPLKVAADGDKELDVLLREHGLERLSISGHVDLSAEFDRRKPERWTARGSLLVHDAYAETRPAGVTLDRVKGRLTFSRARTMKVTARDFSARVNKAPVRVSGNVTGIGTPRLLTSGRAYAKRLDLSHLAELLPALREMKPTGILDLDIDVHVPFAAPEQTRLKGTVTTRDVGFRLAAAHLDVAKGDMSLKLAGDRANIESSTMEINDQAIALTGHLANPPQPSIELSLTSPDLNLDRLLPPGEVEKSSSRASKREGDRHARKSGTDKKMAKPELPAIMRKMNAGVHLQAARGLYKGLQLEKMKLDVVYKRGVIERYEFETGTGEGRIAMKGSADLMDLDRVAFKVDPNVSALRLEAVAPAFGIDKLPITGPLTMKGQLRGSTGGAKELLESLDGTLEASLGPGTLNKVGKTGEFLAKLASLTSISSLFSGRLVDNLSTQGITFEAMTTQSTFNKGTLNVDKFGLDSDAMTVKGKGKIDLIKHALNVELQLVPLATIDEALNIIPLVGKEIEDVTQVHIEVVGPLNDPDIHTAEVKDIGEDVGSELKKPATMLEDIGERLKKMF